MDNSSVRVEINTSGIIQRINNASNKAQMKLDAQVLKDSNYYCPMDTSMLQKSAILSSVIGSGLLVWNTPYAHKQYYECPNKNTDKNPNAQGKWFEAAKSRNLKQWEDLANDQFDRNFE